MEWAALWELEKSITEKGHITEGFMHEGEVSLYDLKKNHPTLRFSVSRILSSP